MISIMDKIELVIFYFKTWFLLTVCQNEMSISKFRFEIHISSINELRLQYCQTAYNSAMRRPIIQQDKYIKSTPKFPRFRDIFIFSSQLSVTAQHLGVTLILRRTGSRHAPDTLGHCLGPLSYQTYQIFNNKHLNRSSLSALRTNDPPWWLCSSSLPILDTEIQPLILIRNVHSIKTLQIAAAITSLMSRTLMSNVIN